MILGRKKPNTFTPKRIVVIQMIWKLKLQKKKVLNKEWNDYVKNDVKGEEKTFKKTND